MVMFNYGSPYFQLFHIINPYCGVILETVKYLKQQILILILKNEKDQLWKIFRSSESKRIS